ncbi:TetR/AcrR family transcriptional regulator [Streptomyces sp. NPDC000151]|uniref:TetR/AcrR family transcriptional regulator n=1 Tax=Streptomyces sp. NPDC000151 TaxID=3154244 RepID=UPI00332EF6A7
MADARSGGGPARKPTRKYAGRPAAERRAERRERLLEAGLQLFGAGPGYRATSVTALCEEAGLSTRQFYEEFRNLEELLAALHAQVNGWGEEAAVAALAAAAERGVEERAAAAVRAYAEAVTDDPRRARVAFVEVVGVSPAFEQHRMARRAQWADLISAELTAAAARGEAAPRDYRLAATVFVAAVNGFLYEWSAGFIDAPLDAVVTELVHLLLGTLHPLKELSEGSSEGPTEG